MTATDETLAQLSQIRALTNSDPAHYAQAVEGVQHLAENEDVRLRQWAVDYFVDALDSDADPKVLRSLSIKLLDPVLALLNNNENEKYPFVLKSTVTCATCIYPLAFSHFLVNQSESDFEAWNKLCAIKSKVLQLWNGLGKRKLGVSFACIKFAQLVIQTQTPDGHGSFSSPSSSLDLLDVSLSSIPRNHKFLSRNLEAEAQALLDRLLDVFSQNILCAPIISATIFALNPLIRQRPSITSKIFRTLLDFDSALHDTVEGSDARKELEYRFVDRSLRTLFDALMKSNVESASKYFPFMSRYLKAMLKPSEKLKKAKARESAKGLQIHSNEADVNPKRARHDNVDVIQHRRERKDQSHFGSYAQLYTLIDPNNELAKLNTETLPHGVLMNIAMAGLMSMDKQRLTQAIAQVRSRLDECIEFQQQRKNDQRDEDSEDAGEGEEDEDYGGEGVDDEDVGTNLDEEDLAATLPASSFSMAPPKKLSKAEREAATTKILSRFISYDNSESASIGGGTVNTNAGINRIAVSEWKSDTWIIFASRSIARGVCDRETKDKLRTQLLKYAMDDFKERIEVLAIWLNEEWMAEYEQHADDDNKVKNDDRVYDQLASRTLDNILPFVDKPDLKAFLRLLSDMPDIAPEMIPKFKSLCLDPYRSDLGYKALRYLIMLRPPVKEACLDLLQDLYNTEEEAKTTAGSILKKYRPQFEGNSAAT